jgi:hypothetical protein
VEVQEKIQKILEMEKLIILSNIAKAQGKSKAKLVVEENYQECMK